jgi:hypothetical protein
MQNRNSNTSDGMEPVTASSLNLVCKYSKIIPIDKYFTAHAHTGTLGRSVKVQYIINLHTV